MSKIKRLGISLVILAVLISAPIIFITQHYVPPILMYHSVGPDARPENRLVVSAATFERQVRFLKNHKYNVLPLENLADLIRQHKKIPPKTVAITFDDGYKDFYVYAYPILKKYNLAATMFVIINEVERPQGDRLSWNNIREMNNSGIISFGSHALGPEPLINLKSKDEVKRQIFDSKVALEENTCREVKLFSYPEGRFNTEIRELVVRSGYRAAVATNPGRNYPSDDIFALKRLRISENAANLFVFWAETSGFYTFFKERRHK
jgi:peptidoglycan/xylan/chitin deacetylase (PgdA/CDA1 family)